MVMRMRELLQLMQLIDEWSSLSRSQLDYKHSLSNGIMAGLDKSLDVIDMSDILANVVQLSSVYKAASAETDFTLLA